MSTVDRLKHLIGVDSKLSVKLAEKYIVVGKPVRFEVMLDVAVPTRLRQLVVRLLSGPQVSSWDAEGMHVHSQQVLAQDVHIEEGDSYNLHASISLPEDARPTNQDDPYYWTLCVKADIVQALDVEECVEVGVGVDCQLPWETVEPIVVNGATGRVGVSARGTYHVARPVAMTESEVARHILPSIQEALATLLSEHPNLLANPGSEENRTELAGALREILIPRVRETEVLAIDSVDALTVDQIRLRPAS